MDSSVPTAWLFDPVDEEEIESEWLDKPGPYGVSSDEWAQLKSQMKKGDEIRAFSSPPDSWENLVGRAGYALVRKGEVVVAVVTMMN